MSSRVILLLFATLVLVVARASAADLSSDESSLAALKSYVTSDPYDIFSNDWSDSTFVCNWTGVTCGGNPLRVVGLDLSYADLVGTVPPHLGNISSLVALGFRNNSFHGVLPSELSRLTKLNNLSFGFNDLTGDLPSWLGSLPRLERLWLYGNRFSGSIPAAMFNATSLQSISLSNNQLSGNIPKDIVNLKGLQMLFLSNNKLTGSIPQFLFNMLASLTILEISENGFSGTLPHNIELPLIQEMYLAHNQMSGQIPTKLWHCKQLLILSLAYNNFSGAIDPSIGNLTQLVSLALSDNSLEGMIPHEIGALPLESMDLADNEFSGSFPMFVLNISSLKNLALSANSFDATTLPNNLCQHLPNLQRIYLVENGLKGQLPTRLSECKQLQVLSLSGNNFQGSIPSSICDLSNATEIYLNFNELTGSIPEDIGNLGSLQSLDLHDNKLSGPLPKSISNASNLTELDISSNQLSGFLPNTLSDLKKIRWLGLSNNSLTLIEGDDNILSNIGSLRYLKMFDLSFNPLSTTLPSISNTSNLSLERLSLRNCNLRGGIPSSFLNFKSLIFLGLEENRLNGPIPPSIGLLKQLQVLFLSDNLLDGPIPQELCKLDSLYALHLSNNMLSGSIPMCLGSINSLRNLYLDSNKFNSEIPPSLWGLKDVLRVDLSSNSLSGSLSPDIGNLKALTYFSVSNNRLSGNISSTIGGLQALITLALDNNSFNSSIPDSIGHLLTLESLDLSYNNFSGVIPISFEKLLDLKFLNLSFNKLSGEIPSKGPFSNFSFDSFIHNENLCGPSRLNVPACKSGSTKARIVLVLECVIPLVTFVAVIIMLLLIFMLRRKRSENYDSEPQLAKWRRITRFEIVTATNRFSAENFLGMGSFGSVYKGLLSDGLTVAIKVFNLQQEAAFESFTSECEVLCNIRHRNLVKVITSVSSPDFKALVLQYMPHGSLEKLLYFDGSVLTISQRLSIMIDVASALEYLHYGYSTPIVHCDLKPSNVLLDENLVAHVADFGISKLLCGDDSITQTTTLATIGYMPPEYGVGGNVSRKGDVFSFGIMMIEVFTKKKPIDEMFSEEMNIREWIEKSLSDSITQVIDSELLSQEDENYVGKKDCVSSILELGLACSAISPRARVDMKVVVSTLNKIKSNFVMNSC